MLQEVVVVVSRGGYYLSRKITLLLDIKSTHTAATTTAL